MVVAPIYSLVNETQHVTQKIGPNSGEHTPFKAPQWFGSRTIIVMMMTSTPSLSAARRSWPYHNPPRLGPQVMAAVADQHDSSLGCL
jgi:hypothetical protein